MKALQITIGPEGAVTIEAQGFIGQGCESKVIRELEAAIGADKARTRKPEFYQQQQQGQRAGQGGAR